MRIGVKAGPFYVSERVGRRRKQSGTVQGFAVLAVAVGLLMLWHWWLIIPVLCLFALFAVFARKPR